MTETDPNRETKMATVRTKISNERSSGNRTGWSKRVTSVDVTKTNGYAFEGVFASGGTDVDLPIGCIIIQKCPEGSVKRSWDSGHCYRLGSDGQLYETDGKSYNWTKDFLSFRDQVAAALAKTPFDPVVGEDVPLASADAVPTADPLTMAVEAGLARINGEGTAVVNPLAGFSDDEIRAEFIRRGLTVQSATDMVPPAYLAPEHMRPLPGGSDWSSAI